MSRRERNKQALREKIFQALWSLLADYELVDIPITLLCEKAEVSKRTFYVYYDSKEAVLAQWANLQNVDAMKSDYQSITANETDLLGRLAKTISNAKGYYATLTELEKKANRIANQYELTHAKDFEQHQFSMHVQHWAQWLIDAQKNNEVRSDFSADYLAKCVVGVLFGIHQSVFNDFNYPFEERLEQAQVFILKLLSAS